MVQYAANVANVSTEHIVEQIGIKFSVMCFSAQNNTLPVHHVMTTGANEIWTKLDYRMKHRCCTVY